MDGPLFSSLLFLLPFGLHLPEEGDGLDGVEELVEEGVGGRVGGSLTFRPAFGAGG